MFDWIITLVERSGYIGVFFLMFLENIFPPIPSELILPLVGFSVAQGTLGVLGVFAAALLGGLVGVLPWYVAGRVFSLPRLKVWVSRYGRLLTLTPEELEYTEQWFVRYGRRAVLFGRLVPIVRTLISIPAGLVRMSWGRFLLYSAIGAGVWNICLIASGYLLESQYARVEEYLNPVTYVILVALFAWYLYRVATWGRRC